MTKAYTITKRVDKQNGELLFTKFYSERTIQSRKLQREVDTKGKVGRDCNNSEGWRETESVYHRIIIIRCQILLSLWFQLRLTDHNVSQEYSLESPMKTLSWDSHSEAV